MVIGGSTATTSLLEIYGNVIILTVPDIAGIATSVPVITAGSVVTVSYTKSLTSTQNIASSGGVMDTQAWLQIDLGIQGRCTNRFSVQPVC